MSGLIGGLAAMGLSRLMRGQLEEVFRGRTVADLVKEYERHIDFFGLVFIAGLIAAIFVYKGRGGFFIRVTCRLSAYVCMAQGSRAVQ